MRPFALLVLGVTLAGMAQPPPPPDPDQVIRVDVELVNIFFSVRDRNGAYAARLTKDDFEVFEDGKPMELKAFSRETDLPLTIGLLVDVSKSQENLIGVEREASARFFSSVLRQKDMAFVISFGADVELLQDLTNSAAQLRASLKELRLNAGVYSPVNPGTVPTTPRGTVLYDAVFLAAADKLRDETGRKAVVLITDGNDYGSRVKMEKAIEEAQRSDAIIYSILYEDPMYTSGFYGGRSGEGPMRRLSEETGGRLFRVDRRLTLGQIYDEIQAEMRSQYALAYSPPPGERGGFRKIEIRPKQKGLKVQARKGYYAAKS
jgi:VWFA-related protein